MDIFNIFEIMWQLFWKTINPRTNQECPVTLDLDTFYTYFLELCSQNITPTNISHTSTFLQNYTCTVDELDKDISIAEVEYAIKLLKSGKSTGYRHAKLPPIGGFQTFLFGSGSFLWIIQIRFNIYECLGGGGGGRVSLGQGWGQVQLTKYSSTPSTPNLYQVQVLV